MASLSATQSSAPDPRRDQLAANLAAVRQRIAAACHSAGRSPDEVRLVVVTKTYPASDVLRLVSLGITDVGENRDQEAAPKAAQVARSRPVGGPAWHFIGQLQRNKCRSVVGYAAMVESVDSVRLAQALDRAAASAPGLEVLVQISLDAQPGRGGAVPGGADPDTALDGVLAAVAGSFALRLRGLMAVAPVDEDPDRAFARLAGIADRVRADYPQATVLSAGMSGDIEQAIRQGATHVRVGRAILGTRPPLG